MNLKHQISWQTQDHHLDRSDTVLNVNIIHETILKYNQKCWIAHSILFEFNYHDVLIMCHKNKIDSWIQSWIVFYAYQWKIIIQKIQIDDEISLIQNFFDKIAEDEFDWFSTVSDSWKQHDWIDHADDILSKMQQILWIEFWLSENLHSEFWSLS